jgi:HPt (histidine-containing phosphotransfer) domain-containing protein
MNLKALAKKLEIDEDEFLELVSLFLKTSSSNLNQLQAAIEEGDTQKVVGLAHSVKGAAVTLGLTTIFEYGKKMEANARVNNLDGIMGLVKSIQEELDRIAEGLNQKVKFTN